MTFPGPYLVSRDEPPRDVRLERSIEGLAVNTAKDHRLRLSFL